MVRVRRLELLWVAPLEPKSSASTNFAIPAKSWAWRHFIVAIPALLINWIVARKRCVGARQIRFYPASRNHQHCRNNKSQNYFFHAPIIITQ